MLARMGGPPAGAARLTHTKWAWRRTAKCVICEIGILFASAMAAPHRPPAFTGPLAACNAKVELTIQATTLSTI